MTRRCARRRDSPTPLIIIDAAPELYINPRTTPPARLSSLRPAISGEAPRFSVPPSGFPTARRRRKLLEFSKSDVQDIMNREVEGGRRTPPAWLEGVARGSTAKEASAAQGCTSTPLDLSFLRV